MSWRYSFKKLMSRPRSESSSAQLELVEYRFLKKTRFRIVVMGGAEVGKTCLVSRLLYEKFLQEYKATVEEMHIGLFEMNGLPITLDILDTSGSLEFPAMRRLSISTGDAFILVYSVDRPTSFHQVERLRKEILDEKEQTMTRVPIVIVANKVDLELDMESTARRRSRAASEVLEGRKKERVKSRASSATLETGWFRKRADLIEDVKPNFTGFSPRHPTNLNKNTPYLMDAARKRASLIEGAKQRADLIENEKRRADLIESAKPNFTGFAALDSRYHTNLNSLKAVDNKIESIRTSETCPSRTHPSEKASKNQLNICDLGRLQYLNKLIFKSEKDLNLLNANQTANRSTSLFNASLRLNSFITNEEEEKKLVNIDLTYEDDDVEKALRLEELHLEAKNLNAKRVQRALTESLVTLDWGHGYVEISAKEDDDITTVIFKELLAQVDLQLKEDVKCVEKMPSRHFSLKARKPSRFARRRSSCKVS